MSNRIVAVALIAAVSTLASSAYADESAANDSSVKIEFGARLGYSLPFGEFTKGSNLGDTITRRVPLLLDVGIRPIPALLVGAYLGYAPGFTKHNDYSASTVDIGVQAAYHIIPTGPIDPWVGLGVGWEIINLSMGSYSGNANGFSFKLEGGADFLLLDNHLGVGPFLSLAFAQYSNCGSSMSGTCTITNQTLHEWLTFGVRGYYDLSL